MPHIRRSEDTQVLVLFFYLFRDKVSFCCVNQASWLQESANLLCQPPASWKACWNYRLLCYCWPFAWDGFWRSELSRQSGQEMLHPLSRLSIPYFSFLERHLNCFPQTHFHSLHSRTAHSVGGPFPSHPRQPLWLVSS